MNVCVCVWLTEVQLVKWSVTSVPASIRQHYWCQSHRPRPMCGKCTVKKGKFAMKYQPCKIHACVYVDRYIIGKPKRKFQKESLSIFPLKFNKRFFWWIAHLEIPSLFFRTKRSDRSLYSKRGHRLNFTDRPSPRRHCLTLTRNERNLKPNFGEFSRSVAI